MDYNSILSQIVEEQNGYLRIVDVQNKDFSKYTVMEYIKKNEMEKVASGVYLAPDAWEDKLYSLQIRNRKIIFSNETALYLHSLTDREPFNPVVSVVRGYNSKHLKGVGVIVHTVRPEWIELGLTNAKTFAGNTVRIYDKQRCNCDIKKRRKQMDIQIFQSAITTYFSDKKKDIHKLMEYAKIMKLEERVRQYTEVLL